MGFANTFGRYFSQKASAISLTFGFAVPISAALGADTLPLTALFSSCDVGSGADCKLDQYQKVWFRIESANGEVTKVDTKSIAHFNTGAADVVVYTLVPNTNYDPTHLRRLFFDCAGHFRDDTDMATGPIMDAPPKSVVGQIASLACIGARDTRLEDGNKDNGEGEHPAEYCAGFSQDACERFKATIRSKINPSYCRPGFAVVGSEANRGLTPEQIRTCYLMAGDFSRLSTK